MGWYGEPKAKSVKDLVDIVSKDYKNNFIESTTKEDHFWVLHNNNGITSATCYLVTNDNNELSYKPIPIEHGPNHYDVPKEWLNKITDVEDREKGIYLSHLKRWLNMVRIKNNIEIKPYDFKELNFENIYTGNIKQLKHLVATDPHYGSDIWCRYERKFDKVIDWDIKLIIKNLDYFDTYKDYAVNIKGLDFTLLLKNKNFDNIDKLIDINSNSTVYSRLFKHTVTEIGMDTAQVALGINEYAKEISDYYKDYDNDSLDLDGYRPYFSIKTLTDGLFGNVTEYSYAGKDGAIVLTGWVDDDAGYDEQKILDYLTERLKIEELEKINNSEKKEELDGPNSI